MRTERLETPALVVEESILKKNMAAMQELLAGSKVALRPHYKSHKCAEIARMQIESGAVGMTCAKLSEAIDLADAGIEDILIANQVVDQKRISRLAELAKDCRLTVCVDDADNVRALSKAAVDAGSEIGCLVEYEIGMRRCGVRTHQEVLALAEQIDSAQGLRFEGIQAYAGHLSHESDQKLRYDATAQNARALRELIALLESNGLEVRTLSGGSTGTAAIKVRDGLYTEIQAGSYLFMDSTYAEVGTKFENSLFILTTVLSVKDDMIVVDAGVKSCGVDQGMPMPYGFSAKEILACEEHFQLIEPDGNFKVGDKLLLVPAHCCSTVNLYDKLYFVDGGKVRRRIAVSARGCSR